MDDYFQGAGVFQKQKNRNDIPDAMINTIIEDLKQKIAPLFVVMKDGAFKQYLKKDKDIVVVDSLADFIQIEENKQTLEKLDAQSKNAEEIKAYLNGAEFKENIFRYLRSNDSGVSDIYLEDGDIIFLEKLDIDSFGERINFPQPDEVADLEIADVALLADNRFSVQVSFVSTATLDYCGSYGDYYEYENDEIRNIRMESMDGDGVCDLSEEWDLKFKGFMRAATKKDGKNKKNGPEK